jgi:hypothetical protein
VGPLDADAAFSLTCDGPGGSVSRTSAITVVPAPPAQPTVSLALAEEWIGYGAGTTLTWSTTGVDACTASGAWSGGRPTRGQEVLSNVTADGTYALTCSGTGGSAVSAVSVSVRSALLSWEAPTQNVDGSTLTDLTGFNVYYGPSSGNYPNVIPVADPTILQLRIDLPPGTHFFAATSESASGAESAYSGEVSKTIN